MGIAAVPASAESAWSPPLPPHTATIACWTRYDSGGAESWAMTLSSVPSGLWTASTVNASSRERGCRPRSTNRSTAPPAVIPATRRGKAPTRDHQSRATGARRGGDRLLGGCPVGDPGADVAGGHGAARRERAEHGGGAIGRGARTECMNQEEMVATRCGNTRCAASSIGGDPRRRPARQDGPTRRAGRGRASPRGRPDGRRDRPP